MFFGMCIKNCILVVYLYKTVDITCALLYWLFLALLVNRLRSYSSPSPGDLSGCVSASIQLSVPGMVTDDAVMWCISTVLAM